ncbi:VOC family protein [Nocardioides aurantiacus]|uniref:PhnB protein n=1 Tax=Nocardioides aurantiacus TaxID=86796 RepID=A0A3N2CUU8_9ACTN|nr:VOC family protein [Nocardioides aurantiacus]ROR90994.1 PhnB protein [Nocardioides aurantiacus]
MPITTTAHLNFRGNARAALDFYQSVFGGEVAAITFGDAHNVQSNGGLATAEEADQVMWGQVLADNGFHVMVYDVPSALSYDRGDKPVYVSVRGDAESADELTAYWNGLTDGATIQADLGPAPWGAPLYGMLTDRFGVVWVLDLQAQY